MSFGFPPIVLHGESPPLQGLTWQSGDRLRVGRHSSDVDVAINDATVSLRHAEVLQTTRGWHVRDLGSSNGTFVNRQQVSEGDLRLLHHKDELRLGDVLLRVEFDESRAESAVESDNDDSVHEMIALGDSANGVKKSDIRTTQGVLRVEASAQQSWEEAVEGVTPPSGQGAWHVKHVRALLRAGRSVCDVASLEGMLNSVLDDVVRTLRAQRGAVLLVNEQSGELELRKFVTSRRHLGSRVTYSQTLAARSFSRHESLLCADVRRESEIETAQSVLSGSMSSIICALLRTPRRSLGVIHLDRGPMQVPFSRDEFHLADAIAASLSLGIESALLWEREREQFVQTVAALGRAVEIRDLYTANHTNRVTEYSLRLAQALDLPRDDIAQLRIGTPLHDIGKIGIEDAILRKPGRLTDEEFEEMKTHTVKGAVILETIPMLRNVIPIARHHHERWDGKGYPDQIEGENISMLARIVAVADVFDALTSDRPYRDAMSPDEAFQVIEDGIGTHFDPNVARAFLSMRSDIERLQREWQHDDSQLLECLQ